MVPETLSRQLSRGHSVLAAVRSEGEEGEEEQQVRRPAAAGSARYGSPLPLEQRSGSGSVPPLSVKPTVGMSESGVWRKQY